MFEVSCKNRQSSQIDKTMKRVHVENWSTKEKLALASSVLKSGDQNWMSVSRVIRSLGEPNRPPDWFSQKQCAVQYDLLLNNVGTLKRKKRSEKTANENNVDTPGESIVRKLTQERIEELKMLMSEYRALYLKEKRELDDINMGKCDERLNDIAYKLEQWEKHEEEEQTAFIKQHQEKKQKEAERAAAISSLHLTTEHGHTPHTPVEVKPTSPLLTSLLQSPSPALLHRGSGPTISSLLHSAPSVPPVSPLRSTATSNTNTQTTLSKLLESPPAMIHHRSSPVSSTDNILDNPNRSSISPATISSTINRSPSKSGAIIDQLNRVSPNISQIQHEQQIQQHLQQSVAMKDNLTNIREEQISTTTLLNQPLPQIRRSIEDNILNNIKVEVDELTPVIIEDAMEVISNLEAEAEPVEVVVETAPQNQSSEIKIKQDVQDEVNVDESSNNTQNQTGDSDVLEQLDHLAELDSHAVEMIVVGPNQTNVISVNHDGSSENLEEESNVGTSQLSHENVSRHEVLPVDVNVIKEETIEITSSELELTTDDKLDLIASEEAIVLSSSSSDKNQNENEDNKIQVERLVKDLGKVSPSEMKQIIEGAEVIVEGEVIADDTNEAIITSHNNEVVNNDNVVIDNNDKSDIVEVTTTTTSNSTDSDSVIETVIDNVIEVGSTMVDGAVVDNNVVQFTDSNSAVIELSEADTNTSAINVVASTGDVTTNIADESQEAVLPDESQSKNYDYDERTIEPDSSSCSIDESDNRGHITDDISKDDSCTGEADKINNTTIDKTKSMEMNQLSSLPSSSSSIASPLAMANIALHLPPSTIEAVSSSSRPDTPSTEEDNEPVANLVKKLPRKASDSVPNSPLSGSAEDGASLRAWKKSIMLVYNRLATHKFASLFLKPITDEQAHGYHSVIHRPMDLSTIKKNVESGVLRTTVEFQRDMLLMFQNAIMYNNSTTLVYERASEMQKECIQHMQLMVEAMGEGVPLRRESLVVDKLITRQRKQDNVGDNVNATPKRKRTSMSNIENAMAKRKKMEEQL